MTPHATTTTNCGLNDPKDSPPEEDVVVVPVLLSSVCYADVPCKLWRKDG